MANRSVIHRLIIAKKRGSQDPLSAR
jgi:hypothetical protein